jgi:membrane-associated protease RseP (regulator of RpoE activity)
MGNENEGVMGFSSLKKSKFYIRVRARALFCCTLFVVAASVGSPAGAVDTDIDSTFAALRAGDVRLGSVFFRLSRANVELCLKRGPLIGLVLHGSGDYDASIRPAAMRYFSFESPVGVEGVVPGSPAARAGIVADDSIVAINGQPVALGKDSRHAALAALDAGGAGAPIKLEIRRGNQDRDVVVQSVAGCRAHAEVRISGDLDADTDGEMIEVDSALMNIVTNPDEFAAVVSHELGHIVLDHPRRLTAAHVDRGLFKGFGRSARLFKQTETEADRISVTLMANAGYDPAAAARYWREIGPRLNHDPIGGTHLSWRARARLLDREAAWVATQPERPIIPAWIASRTQPLR